MNLGGETRRALGMACLLLRGMACPRVCFEFPHRHRNAIMQVLALLQSAHAAGDARSVLGHQVLVGVVVAGEHAHHGADRHVRLRRW